MVRERSGKRFEQLEFVLPAKSLSKDVATRAAYGEVRIVPISDPFLLA